MGNSFVCPNNDITACRLGFVRDTPILIHTIKLLCTISDNPEKQSSSSCRQADIEKMSYPKITVSKNPRGNGGGGGGGAGGGGSIPGPWTNTCRPGSGRSTTATTPSTADCAWSSSTSRLGAAEHPTEAPYPIHEAHMSSRDRCRLHGGHTRYWIWSFSGCPHADRSGGGSLLGQCCNFWQVLDFEQLRTFQIYFLDP